METITADPASSNKKVPRKNRLQSKCRLWERERRGRLSAAFAELASVVPDTPPASAKILVLQRALAYIRRLQASAQIVSAPVTVSMCADETECERLRGELAQLKRRCAERAVLDITNKPLPDDAEGSKKVVEKDPSVAQAAPSMQIEMTSTNPKNIKVKKKISKKTAIVKIKPIKQSTKNKPMGRALITEAGRPIPLPHSTNGVWMGPVLLLPPPLLPPAPAPAVLLVRPSARLSVTTVTRTTTVNKLPIPAFSSSLSARRAEPTRLARVSHRGRRRLLESLHAAKREKNKENDIREPSCTGRKSISPEGGTHPTIEASSSFVLPVEKKSTGSAQCLGSDLRIAKVDTANVKKTDEIIQSKVTENIRKNELILPDGREASSTASFKNGDTPTASSDTRKTDDSARLPTIKNPITKISNFSENQTSLKPSDSTGKGEVAASSSISVVNTSQNDILRKRQYGSETSSDPRVPLETEEKGPRRDCTAPDMAAALLASLGAPPSPASPASPSAASPTAAFLLAFPLVSHARPDTPLVETAHAPLDNFSNFFGSKDDSLALGDAGVPFQDCRSKNTAASDRPRVGWPDLNFCKSTFSSTIDPFKVTKNSENQRTMSSDKPNYSKLSASSSSCAFSEAQSLFPTAKSTNPGHFITLADSIFNYEHAPVTRHPKDYRATSGKNHFDFENIRSQPDLESKPSAIGSDGLYISMTPNYTDGNRTDLGARRKRDDTSLRLTAPGTVPEFSSVTVNSSVQSKPVFLNTSNVYSSSDAYNPFGSDFVTNSVNLGFPCGTVNSARGKSSGNYFPDFNSSNVYSQSCGLWPDEIISADNERTDCGRRVTAVSIADQNLQISDAMSDFQPDFRFPLLTSSKPDSVGQAESLEVKGTRHGPAKFSSREHKYPTVDNKRTRVEHTSQRGPVNWMTSGVPFAVSEPFSDCKETKTERVSVPSHIGLSVPDPAIDIVVPGGKKVDVPESPFYLTPPGCFVPEEMQFGWSPSKTAPSVLPTLLGDLALPTAEARSRRPPTAHTTHAGRLFSRPNESSVSTTAGTFFSVSQLVERNESDVDTVTTESHRRKSVAVSDRGRRLPHQALSGASEIRSKDVVCDGKRLTTGKNPYRNDYSTEALLQNDHRHQTHGRQRQAPECYSQSQQYVGNTFYGGPGVTANPPFYSSSSFISAPSATVSSNFSNGGFSSEMGDYSTNTAESYSYVSRAGKAARKTVRRTGAGSGVGPGGSPGLLDDSLLGYLAGPAPPYPSQPTSLANFNLSTIFPEINKRPAAGPEVDWAPRPPISLFQ